ncbi:MmgE/PrpD family protein [Bradyrhizobium prioriisuperbiae]|uniref:MmgE/PrpD family protein n=1 Tax=Bradyrhizobium prioriisuperbiae TaxID=2854389 RepID=UPI0028EC21AF|nr:MmgE/PrpD family protein [Bradyrhizobium prioritasuperba]
MMQSKPPAASAALASFAARARWQDFPEPVRQATRRSLLNGLSTALGSAHDPAVDAIARTLRTFSGPEQATLIGRRERMDAASAAFVNAVAINLLDFDDTHMPTIIHPTAPVAPVALALAEWRGLSGLRLLESFAIGAEIECRIGLAVTPGHYARGWHITSTCGVFGAAAAAVKLLDIDDERTANALGIAASLSAGLVENLPTAAKNAGVGNAARSGLLAALLAGNGQRAAATALEGPLGWARATGDEPDVTALTGDLGRRWEFARNTFKPYPAGIVMHAVIDACLALRSEHALDPGRIASVTVTGDALLLARGDRVVTNDRDARVSIHHCAAVALLHGEADVREFSETIVFDPVVVALRGKVRAELDPSMPVGAACVAIKLTSGRSVTHTVLNARGSLEQPLSDADIEAKLRKHASAGAPGCDADRIIEAVWTLDRDDEGLSRLIAAIA